MTLKQSQGHQTHNKNVDPKQSYNHAKFERFFLMVFEEEPTLNIFQRRKYVNYLPWTYAKKKQKKNSTTKKQTEIVVYSWSTWHNQQLYKVWT